jgi:hypothetical protein
MTTLRDIMNLPDAIGNELEYRSQLKAEALAHRLVNKFTGNNMPINPNAFNPYLEESEQEYKSNQSSSTSWGNASTTDSDKYHQW